MRVVNFEMDASPTPGVKYRLYEKFTDPDGNDSGLWIDVLEDIGQLQFSLPDSLRDAPFQDGTYAYHVTAYLGDEESAPSNEVSKNFIKPEPPTGLQITG